VAAPNTHIYDSIGFHDPNMLFLNESKHHTCCTFTAIAGIHHHRTPTVYAVEVASLPAGLHPGFPAFRSLVYVAIFFIELYRPFLGFFRISSSF